MKSLSPWKKTLAYIRSRCLCKSNPSYMKYGGRGIKCLISSDDLKILWVRDRAYEMKSPTIDRIDADGNYEFSNCQYLELIDNSRKIRRGYRKPKCKNGHLFSGKNLYTKKDTSRYCRTCRKAYMLSYRKKIKLRNGVTP